ncbi:MAG: DUF4430 domain-containing protein [Ruminococcaceae bacterium]|nr:DUF4430 domain-containing protein [Oscillospiraceae bacterium]
MVSKFSAILIYCLTFILILSSVPCYGENSSDNFAERAENILDGILSYHDADSESNSVQSLIDGKFSENASQGAEWYILALSQYGSYDFSRYEASLTSYLENNTVRSASSRLKYALTLAAIESSHEYISATLDDSIGKQGLMSWVFGLHLLNNGYVSNEYSSSDIVNKLLGLQCDDGGWAITGQYGDVDATAMTVQALVPFIDSNENVKSAIDEALSLLSEKQLADGTFASYGVSNSESTVQVLIALSSLGIDCANDSRFIKNGNSLFDGIEKFKLDDGSFSHIEGEKSNENATIQVLCGVISYLRLINGENAFYSLDKSENNEDLPVEDPPSEVPPSTAPPEENIGGSNDGNKGEGNDQKENAPSFSYKLWVILAIAVITALICLILLLKKRMNCKKLISALLIAVILSAAVYFTDIKSADDYYSDSGETKENIIGSVTVKISCEKIAGLAEHIPSDGIILDTTAFDIEDGDSVYSILVEASKKYKIQFENNGSDSMAYISGINYIYEFDFGDLSGWTYTVNGKTPSVGASEYKLSDGDVIEWNYTLTLGDYGG